MRLEKREVTLNEKDTLRDMIFFEESLMQVYQTSAAAVEGKESKCVLEQHAEALKEKLDRLTKLLNKPPKM